MRKVNRLGVIYIYIYIYIYMDDLLFKRKQKVNNIEEIQNEKC